AGRFLCGASSGGRLLFALRNGFEQATFSSSGRSADRNRVVRAVPRSRQRKRVEIGPDEVAFGTDPVQDADLEKKDSAVGGRNDRIIEKRFAKGSFGRIPHIFLLVFCTVCFIDGAPEGADARTKKVSHPARFVKAVLVDRRPEEPV
ncbi:MAG: hypothetical protein IKX91_00765, partial [Firmicutes bacterium]|nr:hypothetical protein [Bacillota bacterium]